MVLADPETHSGWYVHLSPGSSELLFLENKFREFNLVLRRQWLVSFLGPPGAILTVSATVVSMLGTVGPFRYQVSFIKFGSALLLMPVGALLELGPALRRFSLRRAKS